MYKKGTYYIGDPCYVLSDKNFEELCLHQDKLGYPIEIEGEVVYFDRTAHGDGVYRDNKRRIYPVDTGTIAIIPISLVDAEKLLSNFQYFSPVIKKFKDDFTVDSDDGIFNFGDIVIDTKGK